MAHRLASLYTFPVQVSVYEEASKTKTLNSLMETVTGTHVAILDVDDVWLPQKLWLQVQLLRHEDVDVVGTNAVYMGDKQGVIPIPLGPLSAIHFQTINPIVNSSVLIRKEWAHWHDVMYIDDYNLWVRILKQGGSFHNIDAICCQRRVHTSSAFKSQQSIGVEDLLHMYNTIMNG